MNVLKIAPFVIGATALFLGCSVENSKNELKKNKSDELNMEKSKSNSDFFIGKTNFGVQIDKSRFDVTKEPDGRLYLTVEIRGDDKSLDKVRDDEKSEWNWVPSSPLFYLRKYPVPGAAKAEGLTVKLKPDDDDKYDLGLYIGEHFRAENVVLKLTEDSIEISGRSNVESAGKHYDFRIRWVKK